MEIICESCQSKFKIADEKLPKDKTAFLKCPKCSYRISIPPAGQPMPSPDPADFEEDFFSFEEDESEGDDTTEKPFDFVEEEGKTALLCEPDPAIKKVIIPVLDVLEYHITEVKDSREALKSMRYHGYDLIVVNEYFDTKNPDANGVLIYLERLAMAVRRDIFVALVTRRFRTMDHMVAFQKSVNMMINVDNIADFDKILRRGLADHGLFYQTFKDCLK
ncbi:Response regulator receiver protein [Desulfosarcina cetonica]|uniref:zinc-ribbon domain-containing protein n=1 Tax=Desulfosarcina cetonica TaxID=90730 RepID=UPI0006CFD1CB|nr:zinc-ribbon domain-containing protein [Desulfosarcina cetonica]VTR66423.1 Response regulator receiver protein [Desulfosarcina cetonica]